MLLLSELLLVQLLSVVLLVQLLSGVLLVQLLSVLLVLLLSQVLLVLLLSLVLLLWFGPRLRRAQAQRGPPTIGTMLIIKETTTKFLHCAVLQEGLGHQGAGSTEPAPPPPHLQWPAAAPPSRSPSSGLPLQTLILGLQTRNKN